MGHSGYALVSIVPTRSRHSYFLHTFVNPAYSKHLLNIKALHASFPDLPLNAWYADDGTIAVPIPIARQVIDFLVTKGAPRGFSINLRKTRLGGRRFHRQNSQELRSLPCTVRRDDSVEVLGAPIGPLTAAR